MSKNRHVWCPLCGSDENLAVKQATFNYVINCPKDGKMMMVHVEGVQEKLVKE